MCNNRYEKEKKKTTGEYFMQLYSDTFSKNGEYCKTLLNDLKQGRKQYGNVLCSWRKDNISSLKPHEISDYIKVTSQQNSFIIELGIML